MSSQKKARGLPGMKEGPLVQMLGDRTTVLEAIMAIPQTGLFIVLSLSHGLVTVLEKPKGCFKDH
jgi:hypothetical protein